MAAQAENGRLQAALEQAHADAARGGRPPRGGASLRLELQGLKEQSNLQREKRRGCGGALRAARRRRPAAADARAHRGRPPRDAHGARRALSGEGEPPRLRGEPAAEAARGGGGRGGGGGAQRDRGGGGGGGDGGGRGAAFVETKVLYGSPSSTLAHERRGALRTESYLSMPPAVSTSPSFSGSEGYPGSGRAADDASGGRRRRRRRPARRRRRTRRGRRRGGGGAAGGGGGAAARDVRLLPVVGRLQGGRPRLGDAARGERAPRPRRDARRWHGAVAAGGAGEVADLRRDEVCARRRRRGELIASNGPL